MMRKTPRRFYVNLNLVIFFSHPCTYVPIIRTIELQEEHHEAIVPALLGCIDPANGGCPRVLHRALLTLATVVEACPQGGVMPHSEGLLERFVFVLCENYFACFGGLPAWVACVLGLLACLPACLACFVLFVASL